VSAFLAWISDLPFLIPMQILSDHEQAGRDNCCVVYLADQGEEIRDEVKGVEHIEQGSNNSGDGPEGDFSVFAPSVVFDNSNQQFKIIDELAQRPACLEPPAYLLRLCQDLFYVLISDVFGLLGDDRRCLFLRYPLNFSSQHRSSAIALW
jgi:hypothetical protein